MISSETHDKALSAFEGWLASVSRHFMCGLAILSLLSYLLMYAGNAFGPPIRADGEGYYAYLPAFFIHADPSFRTLADERFEGDIPTWTGLLRYPPSGLYLNQFNLGVALLMTPFFLLAHIWTWIMQSPPGGHLWWKFHYAMDGYSLFYQHAAGLSGVFYFLAGCSILKRLLEAFFPKTIALWTLLALVFGTNLFHYGTGETVFSTPYSFFLVTTFLWTLIRWHSDLKSLKWSVLLGCLAGMIILVRLNNLLYWTMVPLYVMAKEGGFFKGFSLLLRHKVSVFVVGVIAALSQLPQILYWKFATGQWLVCSYQHGGVNFFRPEFLNVLFSLDRGVFFWTPLLVLACAGLFFMKGDLQRLVSSIVVVLGLQLFLVASWHPWQWGGSLGHRAFIESYPLLAFPLGALFVLPQKPLTRWLLIGITGACIAWALFFMKLYYTRELSVYGLDRGAFYDILWLRREWLFGRPW